MAKKETDETQHEPLPELLRKRVNRREALAKGATAAVVAGVAVAAGAGGYFAGGAGGGVVTRTVPGPASTVTIPGPTSTVTTTVTVTGTPTQTTTTPTLGDTADERALKAAVELVQALPPEERKVRVLLIAGAAPNWAPVWPEFEQKVGVTVEVDEVGFADTYVKAFEESTVKAGTWDVITTSQHWLADYESVGVVHPNFHEWIQKYGPEYGETTFPPSQCVPLDGAFRSSSTPADRLRGRISSFTVCSDAHTLWLQRALLNDSREQDAFEGQYGYLMPYCAGHPPATWQQYRDMLEFFHRPSQGINGAYLWRTRLFGAVEFIMRFPQLKGVYWDDNMNAQLNSSIARQVAEEMKEINQFMDPQLLTRDLEVVYADFPAGKGFAATAYASLASFTVAAKGADFLEAFRPPGYVVDGKLINNSAIWDQFGNFVNAHAKRAELGYLFLQFMHSPRIEGLGKRVPGFFNDPWRACTFEDPNVAPKFPTGSMPVIGQVFANALPTLQFFGQREIDDAIAVELNNYFADVKDVDTALNDMNAQVNAVTERVGVERQRSAWESFKSRAPAEIKALHGWT